MGAPVSPEQANAGVCCPKHQLQKYHNSLLPKGCKGTAILLLPQKHQLSTTIRYCPRSATTEKHHSSMLHQKQFKRHNLATQTRYKLSSHLLPQTPVQAPQFAAAETQVWKAPIFCWTSKIQEAPGSMLRQKRQPLVPS